jgi:hypothetical protein
MLVTKNEEMISGLSMTMTKTTRIGADAGIKQRSAIDCPAHNLDARPD